MGNARIRTGVFLQARLLSSRLPGKALLPLEGGTVIEHVLRALARIEAEEHALLTDARSVEALAPAAEQQGFSVLVGPEQDVLARFAAAVRRFAVGRLVRATGDNPLVSPRAARALLEHHRQMGCDLSHFLGNPLGTGVEVVEAPALLEAEARARDPYEREHITTYLYRHREVFRVEEPACPPQWSLPEARVTLDTAEDYALLKRLFAELYRGEPLEIEQVVAWWRLRAAQAEAPP